MVAYIPDDKVKKYASDMAAIADFSDFQHGDPEHAHIDADDLLLDIVKEIGLSEVVKEFERCNKWYA